MNEGLTPGRSIAIIRDLEKMLQAAPLRAALEERLRATRAELSGEWGMQRVPLALFGEALPPELRSSRVSVFRAGSQARIERHANADQFSCILRGALTIHVGEGAGVLRWQARHFRAEGHAQQRISYVARGLWHHPHCPAEGDCELVGFHTAAAGELVDEYAATREEAEGARAGTSRPQERG